MALYTPNLEALQYVGDSPRKLWEVGGRDVPVLEKGDIVLLAAVKAVLMAKKHGFELVQKEEIFASEKEIEIPDALETVKNVSPPPHSIPSIEQLNELDFDEVKNLCRYFGVTVGNKKFETLQQLLIPHLQRQAR